MNFELFSILILIGIFINGKSKYIRAKKMLTESQRETALLVFSVARKGITHAGFIMVALLILGLVAFHESNQIIYLTFFAFSLVFHILYHFRLKKQLSLTELPNEFVNVVSKTNIYYLFGLALVVVAFAAKTN